MHYRGPLKNKKVPEGLRFNPSGTFNQELQDITFRLKADHTTQFNRLRTLLSLRKVDDLTPYWFSFSTGATRFGLSDLTEDISQKMESVKHAEKTYDGYSLEDDLSRTGTMWPTTLRLTEPTRKKIVPKNNTLLY